MDFLIAYELDTLAILCVTEELGVRGDWGGMSCGLKQQVLLKLTLAVGSESGQDGVR
jgi:hypothetical protein